MDTGSKNFIRTGCEYLAFCAIMALSLGMRWRYFQLNPLMTRDAALYCKIAQTWSQTGQFDLAYSEHIGGTAPLYLWMLKIGIDLGLPVITWGHFLAFCFSGAFVLAFYLLGKALFDGRRDAALLCMFIAGIHPVIGRISVDILREGPYFMFAALGMAFFVWARKKHSVVHACVCGAFLGAASLVRHEGLELLFLAALALLPWGENRKLWRTPGSYRLPSAVIASAILTALLLLAAAGIPLGFVAGKYIAKFDKISML